MKLSQCTDCAALTVQ